MAKINEKTCPLCGEKWPEEDFYGVRIRCANWKKKVKICGKCTKQVVAEVFCGKKSSHSENDSGKAGE